MHHIYWLTNSSNQPAGIVEGCLGYAPQALVWETINWWMWCLHKAMQQLWCHSCLCQLVLFYSCKTICAMKGDLWWWHPLDKLFVAPEVFLFYFHFAPGNAKCFVLLFILFYFIFVPGDVKWSSRHQCQSQQWWVAAGQPRDFFPNIYHNCCAAREKCKQGKGQNDNWQSTIQWL